MGRYSCRDAVDAAIGRLLSAIGCNPGRFGPARGIRPTQSAYSLAIRRELALADYAVAKRRHKRRKALAKAACSATHDLLRREIEARKAKRRAPFSRAYSITHELLRRELGFPQ